MKDKASENCREFIRYVSKIVHEICNCPQAVENSRQYLVLQTDILHKTGVGCPSLAAWKTKKWMLS